MTWVDLVSFRSGRTPAVVGLGQCQPKAKDQLLILPWLGGQLLSKCRGINSTDIGAGLSFPRPAWMKFSEWRGGPVTAWKTWHSSSFPMPDPATVVASYWNVVIKKGLPQELRPLSLMQ